MLLNVREFPRLLSKNIHSLIWEAVSGIGQLQAFDWFSNSLKFEHMLYICTWINRQHKQNCIVYSHYQLSKVQLIKAEMEKCWFFNLMELYYRVWTKSAMTTEIKRASNCKFCDTLQKGELTWSFISFLVRPVAVGTCGYVYMRQPKPLTYELNNSHLKIVRSSPHCRLEPFQSVAQKFNHPKPSQNVRWMSYMTQTELYN